jgi:hypothetical protein
MGVRKNPTSGDKHQIRVMCFWDTPANNDQNKVTVLYVFYMSKVKQWLSASSVNIES